MLARLCPLPAEAQANGLAPSNIRENTTKLAYFGLFLATKSHYVGYVAGMGIALLDVNHVIRLSQDVGQRKNGRSAEKNSPLFAPSGRS